MSTGPITLAASNTAFAKTQLDIAANTPTKVILKNADTVPHNFDVISGPPPYAKPATQPTIALGGASVTYDIAGLPAGQYNFQCDIHPNSMKGILTVHEAGPALVPVAPGPTTVPEGRARRTPW